MRDPCCRDGLILFVCCMVRYKPAFSIEIFNILNEKNTPMDFYSNFSGRADFREKLFYHLQFVHGEEMSDCILINDYRSYDKKLKNNLIYRSMPADVAWAVDREMDRMIGRLLAEIFAINLKKLYNDNYAFGNKSRWISDAFRIAQLNSARAEVFVILAWLNRSFENGPRAAQGIYKKVWRLIEVRLSGYTGGRKGQVEGLYDPLFAKPHEYTQMSPSEIIIIKWLGDTVYRFPNISYAPLARLVCTGKWHLL